jgi:hypothetical protein
LTASFEADVRSAPDGTGVAAVLGSPFAQLADFIESGLPGIAGGEVERAINTINMQRAVGVVGAQGMNGGSGGFNLCGAFGLEAMALSLAGLTLLPRRRRFRF